MVRRRDKLLEHVRHALEPYRGSKLVVAVSGGLDSVTLLDLVLHLADELELKVSVAHLDHGLRRGSAADARFVEKLATSHSLPFDGKRIALGKESNVEERARDARYKFLESVRKKRRADYIVTAHQADDQVETLFLHLARGTGMAGLAGMRERTGKLIRPLLGVPRKDLSRYVRRHRLAYRLDPTNKSLKIARNRVRRQVITSLSRINPQLVETVSQSMRVLDEEYEVLRALAEHEVARLTVAKSKNSLALAIPKLRRLRRGLLHLVWREALRELLGDLRGIKLQHLENLDDLLRRQTGSRLHLPRGVTVVREYERLVLKTGGTTKPRAVSLAVPGRASFGDVELVATKGSGDIAVRPDVGNLRVRSPKVGDRFKPAGMRGSKLVSDLLTDLKIPRDERPWVPIVTTTRGEIVWVAGIRADRRFAAPADGPSVGLTLKK